MLKKYLKPAWVALIVTAFVVATKCALALLTLLIQHLFKIDGLDFFNSYFVASCVVCYALSVIQESQ